MSVTELFWGIDRTMTSVAGNEAIMIVNSPLKMDWFPTLFLISYFVFKENYTDFKQHEGV